MNQKRQAEETVEQAEKPASEVPEQVKDPLRGYTADLESREGKYRERLENLPGRTRIASELRGVAG